MRDLIEAALEINNHIHDDGHGGLEIRYATAPGCGLQKFRSALSAAGGQP